MTVARHYRMDAAEGKDAELLAALTALAETLRGLPGFQRADLLRDRDRPNRFVFIERWSSAEEYTQGSALLPKDALAPVMASLGGKPDACYLDDLTVD